MRFNRQLVMQKQFHQLKVVYLLFGLFATLTLQAANPSLHFTHLTIADGISQNTVRSIIQDSQGFLWIGTSDGLNRYDGYNFKIYRQDVDDPSTISNNHIEALYEDSDGELWIGTYGGGLNRFDREHERFLHYRHDPTNLNSLSNDRVMALHEDSQGFLWIGTSGGGLNRLDRKKENFIRYQHNPSNPDSLGNDKVRVLHEDSKGSLWVGTNGGGLNRFNKDNKRFVRYRHDPKNTNSLSHDQVYAIEEDSHGMLWIGTHGGGLNSLDPKRKQFVHYRHDELDPHSLGSDIVRALHKDRQGRLWIGTGIGGLDWFDPHKRQFIHNRHDPAFPQSLSNNDVLTLFEDKQGLLWIGTTGAGAGLNYYDPFTALFNHYRPITGQINSLSDPAIFALLQDNQEQLWIGTRNGMLNRFDPNTKQFDYYKHNRSDPHSLIQGRIRALLQDQQGMLWIGSFGGLSRFDPKTKGFNHFFHDSSDPYSLSHNKVLSLYEDRGGALWIGTSRGLNQFDPQTRSFQHYHHDITDPYSLSDDEIFALLEDKNGTLWVGTKTGLNRRDPQQKKFHRYRHNKAAPNSLSADFVMALHEDKQGTLWVGTMGGGLSRFDADSDTFVHYREKDGLANNVINGILEDDSGNLWVSTNQGLSKFDPISGQFINYTADDGLQSNEFNLGAYFKSRSGELYFGGINGFNRFFPEQIQDNLEAPRLVFTDFFIFNQPVPISKPELNQNLNREPRHRTNEQYENTEYKLPKAIHSTKQLTLSYQQSLFSIEFSALDFTNPRGNLYAYKLAGWDKDWNYTNYKNRRATYTNIPPGQYNLKVKAANKRGVWNEQGINMAINILPPWWLSTVMKLIYGILGFTVLAFIYYRFTIVPRKRALFLEEQIKHRTTEIKQKSDYIQQLLEVNIQFSQNVSHSLKTPLNLVLGPIDRMLNQKRATLTDLKRVKRNALRLKKDVDTLVAFSQTSHSTPITKIITDVSAITQELVEDFQEACCQKKQLLTLEVEENLLIYTEPETIERVLLNLLENAMKYTPEGGRIFVSVLGKDDHVQLKVTDSGIGISAENQQLIFERGVRLDLAQSQQGTGIGLAFVVEILQRNFGSIEIESKQFQGTTFKVTLPLADKSTSKNRHKKEELSANTKELISTITTLQQGQNEVREISMDDHYDESALGKPRILVVEDNKDMLAFILESFTENFNCLQATNGDQGLSMARRYSPDMIISDVMMPGTSGQEMLLALKGDPQVSHIPVILVTAAGDQQGQDNAISAGAIHYFSKPYDEKRLIEAVNEALDLQQIAKARIGQYIVKNIVLTQTDFHFIEQKDLDLLNALTKQMHNCYRELEYTNPIQTLSEQVYIEPRRLRRKLSAFLPYNPATVLRDVRLEHGRVLLEKGIKPIQVYEQVGYSSLDYFSRCFKSKYDQSPSEYLKEQQARHIKLEIN